MSSIGSLFFCAYLGRSAPAARFVFRTLGTTTMPHLTALHPCGMRWSFHHQIGMLAQRPLPQLEAPSGLSRRGRIGQTAKNKRRWRTTSAKEQILRCMLVRSALPCRRTKPSCASPQLMVANTGCLYNSYWLMVLNHHTGRLWAQVVSKTRLLIRNNSKSKNLWARIRAGHWRQPCPSTIFSTLLYWSLFS